MNDRSLGPIPPGTLIRINTENETRYTTATPGIKLVNIDGLSCYTWAYGGDSATRVTGELGLIVACTELMGFAPYVWDNDENAGVRSAMALVVFPSCVGWVSPGRMSCI